MRTLDALTKALRYQFTYDSDDRLTTITDGYGNVTTIERDTSGNPTAIVGHYGQRTTLTMNTNGYIGKITNPSNESVQLKYTSDGLLTVRPTQMATNIISVMTTMDASFGTQTQPVV